MTQDDHCSPENLITVTVPMTYRKRGGRKLLIAPPIPTVNAPDSVRPDNDAILKALVRAHRWKKMLESGEFATAEDLAAAEKINPSYLARILRLTLLAPRIIEEVLDGHKSTAIELKTILKPFPLDWEEQMIFFKSYAAPYGITCRLLEPGF